MTTLRGLQILNLVMMAIGVTFVVTLSVVAVMLAFWVDEYPRYGETLTATLHVTMLSAFVAGAGALCSLSLYRRWLLWPAWQVLGWALAGMCLFIVARMMGL